MRWSFRPRPTVGVDVGTFGVHAVALRRMRGRLRVCGVADAPIGRGEDDGVGRARGEAVAAVLDTPGCHRGPVSAGVPGPTALVRRVTIPPGPRAGMAGAVASALAPLVPFPMKDACVGWQPLVASPPRAAGAVEVLAVVARRDRVAERVAVLAAAGRPPQVLDADVCALVNAVTLSHPEAVPQTQLLIHVGHASTLVCVVEGGLPVLVREVSVAGRRYLQSLDRELGLSPADALRRLRGPQGAEEPGVAGIIADVHQLIATEVARTVQLTGSMTMHGPVQVVRVSGGASRSAGLCAQLSETLGMSVQVFDPFVSMDWASGVGPVSWRPAFAVAVGLALREVGDHA